MQTTYSYEPTSAIAGMIYDATYYRDVLSRLAEDAAGVAAGLFVVKGTAEDQAKVPTLTTDVTSGIGMGVVVYDSMRSPGVYAQKSVLPVLRKGRIWVLVEEAVAFGDQAFVRFASGAGGTVLGSFRKSADTATAVGLPGARFRSAAGAQALAILELNLGQT